MKASELRDMTKEELLKKEDELREDIFRMRMKLATGELEDTSKIGKSKKDIARIKTVLKKKEA
jgi:large subunit ribosomal protein L29